MNEKKKEIIDNYIDAYNSFDIDRMVRDMSDDIFFQNISNGEVRLGANSMIELRSQALMSRDIFSERTQTITSISESGDEIEVEIDFRAIWAIDMPPMKVRKGDVSSMKAKSIFVIENEKIIRLTDMS